MDSKGVDPPLSSLLFCSDDDEDISLKISKCIEQAASVSTRPNLAIRSEAEKECSRGIG